jgi:hypothetical protein
MCSRYMLQVFIWMLLIHAFCKHMFQVFSGVSYICLQRFHLDVFFANYMSTNADAQHAPMNTHTQILPLWALSKDCASTSRRSTKSPQAPHLEIDEVATGASLSTGRSSTTKSTVSLNHEINSEKYEHPCQVKNLNLGGQIPPQGT